MSYPLDNIGMCGIRSLPVPTPTMAMVHHPSDCFRCPVQRWLYGRQYFLQ